MYTTLIVCMQQYDCMHQRQFVASIQLCIQKTGNHASIKMKSVQPQIDFYKYSPMLKLVIK